MLTIFSGLTLLGYVIYSWNDNSDKSLFTMQMFMVSMFIFGGIYNLLSEQRSLKMIGGLYFLVAIFIAIVSINKYISSG